MAKPYGIGGEEKKFKRPMRGDVVGREGGKDIAQREKEREREKENEQFN